MQSLRPILCALLALAPLCGCSLKPQPQFDVQRVAVTATSDDAVVLEFTLLATNAADVAYPLREVEYALSIDGRRVFRGVRSAEATVPEGGAQLVRLPVPVRRQDAPDLLGRAHEYRLTGRVAYLMPGPIAEALYDLGLRRRHASFSDSGALEMQPR